LAGLASPESETLPGAGMEEETEVLGAEPEADGEPEVSGALSPVAEPAGEPSIPSLSFESPDIALSLSAPLTRNHRRKPRGK